MIRLVPLVLTFTLLINRPISGVIVLVDFQQQALNRHNDYRALHCATPMVLNSTLNTMAQNYAQYLATNDLFQHSNTQGVGENLYGSSSSDPITFVNGSTPTGAWYNEISLYDFSTPGYSDATGHFTQVVWNASTQLGIGIALTSDNLKAKIVANYYVAGNLEGAFATNVFPLCSNGVGGD